MYSGQYNSLASEFQAEATSPDAIDGFSAIAAALDRGLVEPSECGSSISDMFAILLGWALLAAVILYPALQLAAIAACVVFFCMRSFIRCIFAPARDLAEWTPGMAQKHGSVAQA